MCPLSKQNGFFGTSESALFRSSWAYYPQGHLSSGMHVSDLPPTPPAPPASASRWIPGLFTTRMSDRVLRVWMRFPRQIWVEDDLVGSLRTVSGPSVALPPVLKIPCCLPASVRMEKECLSTPLGTERFFSVKVLKRPSLKEWWGLSSGDGEGEGQQLSPPLLFNVHLHPPSEDAHLSFPPLTTEPVSSQPS